MLVKNKKYRYVLLNSFQSKALAGSEYCDFPDNATCEIHEDDIYLLVPGHSKFIYLTFDDGPWIGTTEVLDALEEEDIKALALV